MRMLLLLPMLTACRDGRGEPAVETGDPDSGEGSSLSMAEAIGCSPELDIIEGVELSETNIGSVPLLVWESSEEIQASVVTDIGREEYLSTPVSEVQARTGELLILGIPYLRESWSMVVAQTESGLACSEVLYRAPATLKAGIPEITQTVYDPEQSMGGYTSLVLFTGQSTETVIVDEYGEYVWNYSVKGTINRLVFSEDGSSVLYMKWAEDVGEPASIVRRGFDGEMLTEIEVTGAHTDFLQLPDGGIATISWDLREFVDTDGLSHSILGDRIVEIDPEGNEREVWNTFDHYEPVLGLDYMTTTLEEGTELIDWSHGNGLSYDQTTDDYLLSLYGLGSLVRVDRETGELQWILSDTHGDFVSAEDQLLVQGTHSVQSLGENEVLLFNRNIPNPLDLNLFDLEGLCSEAVEIRLDLESGTASRTWAFSSDDCLLVLYYGEAIRLENGNTLVIFSSSGQASEANADGETVWEIKTDVGGAFGFGDRRSSLY